MYVCIYVRICTVRVTIKFPPDARTHIHGYRHPTGTGIRVKWIWASTGFNNTCLTCMDHTTSYAVFENAGGYLLLPTARIRTYVSNKSAYIGIDCVFRR